MANRIIVNLDTSKSQLNIFECKQNDDLILEASIFENGIEKDITNTTITINCTRADGTYIIQNTNITKEGKKLIANLKRDFTRVAGLDKLEIVLLENEKQNTTFDFNILVKPSVLKAAVEESKDTVIILEELGNKIVEAGQVKAETENLIATGNAATKLDIANVNSQLEQNKSFSNNIGKLNKNLNFKSDGSKLRFAIVTDIHIENNNDADITYGNADIRTQALIDSVNAEHDEKGLDFLLITGDIAVGVPTEPLKKFFNTFATQLKMPYVVIPGNHDNVGNDVWKEITGFNRQFSFETESIYFICMDTFPNNLMKTSISHWSAVYSNPADKVYIRCKSDDEGALLVVESGASSGQINKSNVTPMASDWLEINKVGNYVKYANVEDADMYEDPSLDYVKAEVAKAGNKAIIFVSHMIMGKGDKYGVKNYLNSLPNFLGYIEGHSHVYNFTKNEQQKFTLNAGHWWYPQGGWGSVASNNYRGISILELEDRVLKEVRVIPTQNIGTSYSVNYKNLPKNILGGCPLVNNNFTTRNFTELTTATDTDYFMFENASGVRKITKNNLLSSSTLQTTNKNVFGAINEILTNVFNLPFVDLPTNDSIHNFSKYVTPKGFLIFKINSYGNQSVTNMPTNTNYYGFIFGFGANNSKIIAFPYGSNDIYIKNNNGGTWSEWSQK